MRGVWRADDASWGITSPLSNEPRAERSSLYLIELWGHRFVGSRAVPPQRRRRRRRYLGQTFLESTCVPLRARVFCVSSNRLIPPDVFGREDFIF